MRRLVAGLLVALAACSSGGETADDASLDAPLTTGLPACPAEGHKDTHASGLTPERIPSLPNGYSFTFVKGDNCTPVRFDPCQPVHYVVNPTDAPPGGVADVDEAFRRLAAATGIEFVNDGATDEVMRAGPYVEGRYPGRWAPILVVWRRNSGDRGGIEIVGSGFPYRVQDVLVSGTLSLNSDATTDRARNTPLASGFAPAPGFGAVGADGVTWGRVILHELAHVMGLGHTKDRDQLMYPDMAEQTARTPDFRSGDREGLRLLGKEAGCVAPVPTPAGARPPG